MDGQNYINEIAFSQPVINIGADSGNDIILRGQGIADFHLMLNYASNVWHLIPLDPSKTTLLNGRGIGPEGCPVENGAVLSIGDYRLTLSLNGIYADIMVAQMVSANPIQQTSEFTETTEGSSILLSLSDKLVPTEIDAGGTLEYELTVTNAGPLVANMQLQLQGIPSAWVQIIPPVLNLNEGRSGNFTVRVSPPRSSAAKAGLYQLHFVAISPNYPRETGIADTVLTVLPYNDFLVNGPTPRRLNLSRSHSSDFADLIIINNSNADATFVVRSNDDANELTYAYKQDAGNLSQGQVSVTVPAGDNERVPIRVETRKRPLIGLTSHSHHYYTSVTPTDRPGDAQTLLGEVTVKPVIHVIWLLIILLLLAIAALFFFQPRIYQFDSIAGKRTEMILAGNSVGITWDVSRFASRITLSNGEEENQVSRQGNEFVSPPVSTTYTLRAENFFSNLTAKLFGSDAPEKEFRVLLIPRRPTIDVFKTDTVRTNYSKPVRLDWAVSSNADSAAITTNKQEQTLAAENYSGSQTNTYTADALISLKASNASGFEEKSVFINVRPDKINLNKFIAWVRPNGIAVPSDNDTRRTTRWGSLQLYTDTVPTPQTIRQAVNPQPDAQSNAILIPDNYASSGGTQGGVSPEQQSVDRILGSSGSDGLLIGSYMDALPASTPVPAPTAVPTAAAVSGRSPVVASSSSSGSPESRNSATREFSIKLVEIIEDPLEDSGYRVIQYFPDYVLQKSEQILIEWDVDGISSVTIENLSTGNLTAAGNEFAYPEKSTNYVLNAEIGDIKKVYSLPVNVAGDTDDSKGSGENCNLKASTTSLAAPGTVMLTWTGGGNDRVQLVSSVKAEKESSEAEKKKEAEAKEKGEEYTKSDNIEMSGGIIGDYLQPSGFMRVDVDRQTTFVLNAFDKDGNVICSKEAEIKYTGGNDKVDLKLAIVKITDTNDVSQPYYTVGQTVQFTVALTDFKKDLEPTGNVMLTDGDSSCTMTLPKDTCSMMMKHEGTRTITAVYGGDNIYNKKTVTSSLVIRPKVDTETIINSALKSAANLANLITELTYDKTITSGYGKTPTGTITFTVGSGTCDLDISTLKITCGGKAVKSGDIYTLNEIILTDTSAAMVRAKYNGDDYFGPSVSDPVRFATVPTKLEIENAYKHSAVNIDLTTRLTWDTSKDNGRIPGGKIVYKSGTAVCTLDLSKLEFTECSGKAALGGDGIYQITGMAMNGTPGDRIYAEYMGDSFFDGAVSETVKFRSVPTDLSLTNAKKSPEGLIDLTAELSWNDMVPVGTKPHGTIKFINTSSDSAFCTMDISGDSPKFSDGCRGSVSVTSNTGKVFFVITDLNTDGKAEVEIMAEYSGDDYFLSAESNAVNFNKVETILVIGKQDAGKNGPDHADISAVLSWNPDDAPAGAKPTGTVKFTAGNGSCTLDLVTEELDCEPKTGTVAAVPSAAPDHYDISVIKMLLSDSNADRVKAEYSGDSVFNPSASTTVPFWTVPTTVTIGTAFKPDTNHANVVDLRLNWETEATKGRTPEGTLTLNVGSGFCLLDVGTGELSGCTGTGGVPTLVEDTENRTAYYTYAIRSMALSDKDTLKIKVSYGGDGFFLASSSDTVDFSKVPTEITITNAIKPEAERADIDTLLSWDPKGTEGFKPTGTIKFTVRNGANGAGDVVTGTCILTLDPDPDKQKLSCDTKKIPPEINFTDGSITSVIKNMLLADKNADRIKAEYSGDTYFAASESMITLFKKIPTKLEFVNDPIKHMETYADVKTLLSWDTEGIEGVKPTGTIKFTLRNGSNGAGDVVTGTCTLDLSSKKVSCDSDDPEITPADGSITSFIKNMLLADKNADRIKAEYSGDGIFAASESTVVLFKIKDRIDTSLELKNPLKSDSIHVDLDALLSWNKEEAAGKRPTGTITFTIGGDSCKMTFDAGTVKSFTCSEKGVTDIDPTGPADIDPTDPDTDEVLTWTLTKILLSAGSTADRVKAEYSGDGNFKASYTEFVLFLTKIPTNIVITKANKKTSTDWYANVIAQLGWNATNANGKTPTGTITFTAIKPYTTSPSGDVSPKTESKCVYDIVKGEWDCNGNISDSPGTSSQPKNGWKYNDYDLSQWLLEDNNADRVKAEYSGDAIFEKSTSIIEIFKETNPKIDTVLKIENASKNGNTVSLTATLTPEGDETGTIVFISGSGTCTLIINDHDDLKFEKCNAESAKYNSDGTIEITGMQLSVAPGDSIYAEYSGDSKYNKSVSPAYYFEKIDTMIELQDLEKTKTGYVNMKALLYWEKDKAGVNQFPTGTVTFTIGSETCKLTFDDNPDAATPTFGHINDFSCSEKDVTHVIPDSALSEIIREGKVYQGFAWTMTDILLNSAATAERAKAEYGGDAAFNASSSDFVLIKLIDTETVIPSARITQNGTVDVKVDIRWDKTQTPDGEEPTGKIKLTAGSASCTLQMAENLSVFTDCNYRSITFLYVGTERYPEFQIYDLKIGDGTAESIKAEYSGDLLFRTSVSNDVFFKNVDTTLEINKNATYKSADTRVNMEATLSWCYYGCIENRIDSYSPTGPVTFTIGSDSCKLDLSNASFSCADDSTVVDLSEISDDRTEGTGSSQKWYKDWKFKLTNVLLSNGNNADRVKADFAGDKHFNPSSSKYVLFPTVPTAIRIMNQEKLPSGLVNAVVYLTWTDTLPQDDLEPSGTIKLTSGSAVCTLDISAAPVRFTDCDGSVTVQNGKYNITGLDFGSGVGADIVGEYSGDGLFLSSKSDKKLFAKVDTELVISSTYKPGNPGKANLTLTLSWDREMAYTRKPIGTVKFTIGSGTCELDLETDMLSCEAKPVKKTDSGGDYQLTITEMLLTDSSADRVKAEYSGDAVFNTSSSSTVLFKTVDTEINISKAEKRSEDNAYANIDVQLSWDEAAADGRKPEGTLKFTIGSGKCTLTIGTGKLDCDPGTGTVSADHKNFSILHLLVSDKNADEVTVEYSGDGFFNTSNKTKNLEYTRKIETSLDRSEVQRSGDKRANVKAVLEWMEKDDLGNTPTGTITIKAGEKTAVYNISANTLIINGRMIAEDQIWDYVNIDYDQNSYIYDFRNLEIAESGDESVTIEYSGDENFNSSQKILDLKKIATRTIIKSGYARYVDDPDDMPPYLYVKLYVSLIPLETALNGAFPTGTFTVHVKPVGNVEKISCPLVLGFDNVECGSHSPTRVFARLMLDPEDPGLDPGNPHSENPVGKTYVIEYYYHTTNTDIQADYAMVQYSGDDNFYLSNFTYNGLGNDNRRLYIEDVAKWKNKKSVVFKINGALFDTAEFIFQSGSHPSCNLEVYRNRITQLNNCGDAASIYRYEVSYGDGEHQPYTRYEIHNLTLGDESDSIMIVSMQGTPEYRTITDTAEIPKIPTRIRELNTDVDYESRVMLNFQLQYPDSSYFPSMEPHGAFLIRRGNYVCKYYMDSRSTSDPGNCSVHDSYPTQHTLGDGSGWYYKEYEFYIPGGDVDNLDIMVRYIDDVLYENSEATGMIHRREPVFYGTQMSPDTPKTIEVHLQDPENKQSPDGIFTLTFNNSGNVCKLDAGRWAIPHIIECDGVASTIIMMSYETNFKLEMNSIDPNDTDVMIRYSGNVGFEPAETSVQLRKYQVTLIPEPKEIYLDGRYYVNTKTGVHARYPYYPEIFGNNAYSHCQDASSPDSDCHELRDTVAIPLSVRVELESPKGEIPDGAKLLFYIDDTYTYYCNIFKDLDGVYRCQTTTAPFGNPGLLKVNVRYEGSNLLESAEADFPDMISVTIPASPIVSTTVIDEPERIAAGDTVNVDDIVVKTYKTGEPTSVTTGTYIYYTYDRVNNQRLQTCTEASCTLNITDETTALIAEFLGNNEYAPSMGMLYTGDRPQVSLNVEVEPGGTEP